MLFGERRLCSIKTMSSIFLKAQRIANEQPKFGVAFLPLKNLDFRQLVSARFFIILYAYMYIV